MVEVFKTNVADAADGASIVAYIHLRYPSYLANFDLDDCDRILRVKGEEYIRATALIRLVNNFGYHAEVLPDHVHDFAGV